MTSSKIKKTKNNKTKKK